MFDVCTSSLILSLILPYLFMQLLWQWFLILTCLHSIFIMPNANQRMVIGGTVLTHHLASKPPKDMSLSLSPSFIIKWFVTGVFKFSHHPFRIFSIFSNCPSYTFNLPTTTLFQKKLATYPLTIFGTFLCCVLFCSGYVDFSTIFKLTRKQNISTFFFYRNIENILKKR